MNKKTFFKNDKEILDLANLFKIFGDSTRIKIMRELLDSEKNVQSIAEELKMDSSAISQQLRILRNNKLVRSRRDGKQIFYALDDEHVKTIIEIGLEHIRE